MDKLKDFVRSELRDFGRELLSTEKRIQTRNGYYRDNEFIWRYTLYSKVILLAIKELGILKSSQINGCLDELDETLFPWLDNTIESNLIWRTSPDRDEHNGVIGLAWIIEALTILRKFGDSAFNGRIEQLSALFEEKDGIFYYNKVIDLTYNHQLWANYALSFSNNRTPIICEPKRYQDGLIYHDSAIGYKGIHLKTALGQYKRRIESPRSALREKSFGYHMFNTYAMSYLGMLCKEDIDIIYRLLKDPFSLLGDEYNSIGFESLVTLSRMGVDYSPVATIIQSRISKTMKSRSIESRLNAYKGIVYLCGL